MSYRLFQMYASKIWSSVDGEGDEIVFLGCDAVWIPVQISLSTTFT